MTQLILRPHYDRSLLLFEWLQANSCTVHRMEVDHKNGRYILDVSAPESEAQMLNDAGWVREDTLNRSLKRSSRSKK